MSMLAPHANLTETTLLCGGGPKINPSVTYSWIITT